MAWAASSSYGQPAAQAPNLERLRSLIRARLAAASVPSLAIAVVSDGQIVWEEAFGSADVERHIPATNDTPYYLASITKTITGAALLAVASRGAIDLDLPINKYLGRARLHSPLWDVNGATVRRVANHTAGLTTYYRTCETERACGVEDAIEKYGVIVHAPGAGFDYSNLDYGVLGDVLARVSKRSFASVLRDEVFRPLKMTSCGVSSPPPQSAVSYDSGSHQPVLARFSDTPGASTAYCSVHDLAVFSQWMTANAPLVETIRARPVPAGAGQQYAFGWWLPDDYFGYRPLTGSGGTSFSSAALKLFPDARIAVAVLMNAGTGFADSIIDETLDEFVPTIRERRARATAVPPISGAAPRVRPLPDGDLIGVWAGVMVMPKEKRPLTLEISPAGDVRAAVDRKAPAPFTRGAAVRRRVGGRTADDVDLGLELQGSRLVGSATVSTPSSALSYWVELRKTIRTGSQAAP